LSIAVFLPPQLLAHVRHVFVKEPDSEGQIATQFDKDWQIGVTAQ